jgi:hypothetical protein
LCIQPAATMTSGWPKNYARAREEYLENLWVNCNESPTLTMWGRLSSFVYA